MSLTSLSTETRKISVLITAPLCVVVTVDDSNGSDTLGFQIEAQSSNVLGDPVTGYEEPKKLKDKPVKQPSTWKNKHRRGVPPWQRSLKVR